MIRRTPTSTSFRESAGARRPSAFTSARNFALEMLLNGAGCSCSIDMPSSRTSPATVNEAEGRACATETITTMASDARSRPDIRMAWNDVLSILHVKIDIYMALKYALLGSLADQPRTGYELLKHFEQSLAYAWPASHSQIYPELARLLEDGLIEQTESGREELEDVCA